MNRRFHLPLTLLVAGLIVTAVHDFAYRRVDSGEGDYVMGLTSYAGSVMLGLTLLLTAVGALVKHRGRFTVALTLLAVGAATTTAHDGVYRWIYGSSGDYELGDVVSHAGADMVTVTLVLFTIAVIWPGDR